MHSWPTCIHRAPELDIPQTQKSKKRPQTWGKWADRRHYTSGKFTVLWRTFHCPWSTSTSSKNESEAKEDGQLWHWLLKQSLQVQYEQSFGAGRVMNVTFDVRPDIILQSEQFKLCVFFFLVTSRLSTLLCGRKWEVYEQLAHNLKKNLRGTDTKLNCLSICFSDG